jgi:ABC-type multidrug transport system permease subunit
MNSTDMKDSAVKHLVLKDWRLNRMQIFLSMAAGVLALGVIQRGGETAFVVGGVWFFMSLILVGHMLPLVGILNERKKQNLAFLMSLPVSFLQYTTAKLLSTLGMFLIPWLTLVSAGLWLIESRGILPRGAIPMALILAFMPFVGFSLITGTVLVSESEGWGIAVNVACSSSYALVWYFLGKIPGLMSNAMAPSPVWNSAARNVLECEFGLVVAILGLTFYLQSKKKDFV